MCFAMLVVVVVHPSLVKIARSKRLVDRPNARKLNHKPVPMLGGVGVLCGIFFGVGLAGCYAPLIDMRIEVILALVIMLYTGVGDDILDFSPVTKLGLQCFAVLLVIFPAGINIESLSGLWGIYHLPYGVSVALTLFAAVGIINAINLIDGVDGLCALYVMMVMFFFGARCVAEGDVVYAVMAFATLGALLPFALHNMYGTKYKMFLGDGGSLALGFICALFAVHVIQSDSGIAGGSAAAFAFAVLSVPVCDTLRVMITRMWRGDSPFRPDKIHLHHMLLSLGLTHRATALGVVLMGVVTIAAWSVSVMLGADADMQVGCAVGSGFIVTWGAYYIPYYALKSNSNWIITLRQIFIKSAVRRTALGDKLRQVLNDKLK